MKTLEKAVDAINGHHDALIFVHPEGVFIPETILPEGWIDDPEEAGAMLRVKAFPYVEGVRHLRASPIRRVRMKGEAAVRAVKYDPGLKGVKNGPVELTGVVINRHSIRPVVRFVNAEGKILEEIEGHWPKVLDMDMLDRDPEAGSSAWKALNRAVNWKPRRG